MMFDFSDGVSKEVIRWLQKNVGAGNLRNSQVEPNLIREDKPEFDWFYERVERARRFPNGEFIGLEYMPTITIKDEKKALWFKLRWE